VEIVQVGPVLCLLIVGPLGSCVMIWPYVWGLGGPVWLCVDLACRLRGLLVIMSDSTISSYRFMILLKHASPV